MLIEQLIFIVISFAIFVLMFFKMIKNNDTSYVIILVLEAIGIALNFLEVLFVVHLNLLGVIAKYVLAILLPIVVLMLEKRNKHLLEMINLTKAKIFQYFGDNKKAKQALIDLLDKYQNSYQAHKMLAQIYEQEGGMRKAIDEYVQAIELDKQDTDSYYRVAKLLRGLDKNDEAAQMLTNLLNKKPEMYEASQILGEILISQERYKEALIVYQEALRYHEFSYDLNYSLGMVYTMLNDFQNAKICYEKAAQINAIAFHANYSLAEIALIYKDLETAEKKFLAAVESEELEADSYFELAKIYLIKGDKDTAIQYANTAIDADSKRMVEKIKSEPLFIPIMAKISIPFNLSAKEETKETMTPMEKKVKEHLEEMTEITRHLSYHDINLLKKNQIRKMQKEKEEDEEKQKNRE